MLTIEPTIIKFFLINFPKHVVQSLLSTYLKIKVTLNEEVIAIRTLQIVYDTKFHEW